MPKFRKKPVEIEAWWYNPTWCSPEIGWDFGDKPDWLDRRAEFTTSPNGVPILTIRTLEGDMHAGHGDWIVRGVQGELYPVKDEIFRATYEAA